MTKFQATRAGDYPTLGFRANTATAILDGSMSTPTLTIPPDASWSVYGGGSAETGITRYTNPVPTPIPPTPEITSGWMLAYSDPDNTFRPLSPADLLATQAWSDGLFASIAAFYTPIDNGNGTVTLPTGLAVDNGNGTLTIGA